MNRWVVLLIGVALLAAACSPGGVEPAQSEQLATSQDFGRCMGDGRQEAWLEFSQWFPAVEAWVEFDADDLAAGSVGEGGHLTVPAAAGKQFGDGGAAVPDGRVVVFHQAVLGEVERALAAGGNLIAPAFPDEPPNMFVVADLGNGDLAFLAPCAIELRNKIESYALEHEPSADLADIFRRVVDTGSPEFKTLADWEVARRIASPTTVPWQDLAPSVRAVDPELTPAEIFDRLTSAEIALRWPETWRASEEALCVRSTLGRQGCVSLRLNNGTASFTWLTVFVEDGDELSVWLTPAGPTSAAKELELGRAAASLLREAEYFSDEPPAMVLLELVGPDIGSTDELRDAAQGDTVEVFASVIPYVQAEEMLMQAVSDGERPEDGGP